VFESKDRATIEKGWPMSAQDRALRFYLQNRFCSHNILFFLLIC